MTYYVEQSITCNQSLCLSNLNNSCGRDFHNIKPSSPRCSQLEYPKYLFNYKTWKDVYASTN